MAATSTTRSLRPPVTDEPETPSPAVPEITRPGRAAAAAEDVADRHTFTLTIPAVGTITLGEPKHLPFYAAVATLAVVEVIEWPVATVIVVGKLLADHAHREIVRDFGRALEIEA